MSKTYSPQDWGVSKKWGRNWNPVSMSLEVKLRLMLKLKFQYFGHLMWKTDSLEKTLMLGKIEGRRRREDRGWDGWMASLIQCVWVWASSGRWWRTGKPGMLQSMGSQRVWHSWLSEQQQQSEWLKHLGPIGNNAQLWKCLVVKGKSDAIKNTVA